LIRIGKAEMALYDGGCFTRYEDGATWGAEPHDSADYLEITKRLQYASPMAYAVAHEVSHNVLAEIGFNRRSVVLWPLAHGLPVNLQTAVGEECAVQSLQGFVQLGIRPIVGDAPWQLMADNVVEVLDKLYLENSK
jgi:hypothetical protein